MSIEAGAMNGQTMTDARSPAYAPEGKRSPNLKALTGIRFFAALYVALFHLIPDHRKWGPLKGFTGAGYVGVSFFFLLSGFILTYSHVAEYEAGRGHVAKFWVARFARIYPVYLLSVAVSAIVYHAEFNLKHAIAFLADLALMQTWSLRMVYFFNHPAWSVSVEVFFYLVFPYVLLTMRPKSAGRALGAVAGFWALAMALPLYCVVAFPETSWVVDTSGPGIVLVSYLRRCPPLALPELLAGVALGWYHVRFPPSRRVASTLATAGLIVSLAALLLGDHLPFLMLHNGLLIPSFGMLLVGLCQPNWLSRLLSHPVLVLLGEASFALYLFHGMVISATEWGENGFGLAAVRLAIAIPLSVLLHLYVERPARRWVLDWWRRHPDQLALVRTGVRTTLA